MSSVFAAITAVCWGIAPMFAKLGLIKMDPLPALLVRSTVITVILFAITVVSGQMAHVTAVGTMPLLFVAGEGILASLVGHFAYYSALRSGQASRIVPITAAFPLITLVVAVVIFRERLTFVRLLGAVLIVVGVYLVKG